eukprot:UN07390
MDTLTKNKTGKTSTVNLYFRLLLLFSKLNVIVI